MSEKTEKILKEIGQELFPYIKSGKFYPDPILKDIDQNLNINNLDKLLRIHFILKKDVITFIEKLEERIRSIKTTTNNKVSVSKKGITGGIDWPSTFAERSRCNPYDITIYSCLKRDKEFEIPENLVLKEFLLLIRNILEIDLKNVNEKYEWLGKWYTENLKDTLFSVYHKNIYLRRIDLKRSLSVTNRMITKATQSRKQLYRECANLFLKYKEIMNYDLDEDEAKELLKNTFIKPDNEDVLFELYWIVKIIKESDLNNENIKFNIIDSNEKSIISSWTSNGFDFTLYHDSVGSFKLKESFSDMDKNMSNEDNYVKRQLEVFKKLQCLGLNKEDTLWGGRPDIILETRKKGEKFPTEVFIGEVKNTKNKHYVIQGFKELLEYMALFKYNSEYYNNNIKNLFENDVVRGALFVDNITDFDIDNNSNLKIYKFGEDKCILTKKYN